ncbi:MAG: hypothetical protein JSS98_08850 [Bacteroidetes bacterium]|nr:hypothetical protein [Bacteroidota bacterium]
MKALLPFCFLLFIFSSCTKDTIEAKPSIDEDTLGTGWRIIPLDKISGFSDIQFYGETGFGIDGKGIYRSTDGGFVWEIIGEQKTPHNNIAMGGIDNIIVAGGNNNSILYSTNQGNTFDVSTVKDSKINEVFFVNENTAYIIGNSFWKTSDAGKGWEKLYEFNKEPGMGNGGIYRSVFFIGELTGWAIAPSTTDVPALFKTIDGGKNWQLLDSGYAKYQYSTVFFVDEALGYLNTSDSYFYKTTDGGLSWESKQYDTLSRTFPDVFFITKDIGYISNNKRIFKTTDGGESFSLEVSLAKNNPKAGILELFFTDANHGWACGYDGAILKYER